jgi:hypothetical protein
MAHEVIHIPERLAQPYEVLAMPRLGEALIEHERLMKPALRLDESLLTFIDLAQPTLCRQDEHRIVRSLDDA